MLLYIQTTVWVLQLWKKIGNFTGSWSSRIHESEAANTRGSELRVEFDDTRMLAEVKPL
jgi:hypothetical protein